MLDVGMKFRNRLEDKEQASGKKGKLAPARGPTRDCKRYAINASDPEHKSEKSNLDKCGYRQSDPPRAVALLLRHTGRDERYEDDIVDAEHEFEPNKDREH